MLNKVMIIGRLGRDPEIRYSQSGMAVCALNIATDESYVDREGQRVERTEWHRVSVFQRMAETCANSLHKGSLVYVEGSLQTRKWQDQNGQDRYTTEIRAQRVLFLERRSDGPSGEARPAMPSRDAAPSRRSAPQRQAPASQPQGGYDEDLGPVFPSEVSAMDEVPF